MRTVTKEDLVRLGITNITEDGRIFKGDYEVKQHRATCKHKYGPDRTYLSFGVYDSQYRRWEIENNRKHTNGLRTILVHRAVYAWFNGETPKWADVDHIDNNPLNNNKNNLRLLSRKENLSKRQGPKNQWFYIKGE